MRKFEISQIAKILDGIAMPVYLPVESGGVVAFERYRADAKVRLDACPTDKSPKDVLFPQWEDLMRFRVEGKTIEITEQERRDEKYVLFGARACDIRAFRVLDNVFLAEPVDTYYAARRENGVIVALACDNPAPSCFCGAFGIDSAAPEADVVMWKLGDQYYFESYSVKGEALTASWEAEEADVSAVESAKADMRAAAASQPFADLSLAGFEGARQSELFNSPKWEKLAMACLGCGSCTFSCPTCQCYDIRDYDDGHGVSRYRCWDSCMYSDFTLMAATNPRTTQTQRYRQRFMHKLVYYPQNNDGLYSCVGCGRCVRKCPMNLNIVKVIKALGEDGR